MKRFAPCVLSMLLAGLLLAGCASPGSTNQAPSQTEATPASTPAQSASHNCGPVLQAALTDELQRLNKPSNFGIQCTATVTGNSTSVVVKVFTADGQTELATGEWTREFSNWEAVVKSGVNSLIQQLGEGPPPAPPQERLII
ncbi:MAG: hypothetical protein JNK33_04520 [Candidatus Doudnabacteria bacterium]|nr:hypothetical protein [Candidatus Doudnabacteria bacterium]